MPADPLPTDAYRQEFSRGHAEDQAWIVQTGAKVDVAYGKLDRVVRSFEWNRLEPGVVSEKVLRARARDRPRVGRDGWDERFELVDVRWPDRRHAPNRLPTCPLRARVGSGRGSPVTPVCGTAARSGCGARALTDSCS